MTALPTSPITRQAGCVLIKGRGVLIEGEPGLGKSSLALALIDRGAQLVGDDGVVLTQRLGQLFAAPHPRTQGLLEVRNLGLLPFPFCESAPIALILQLTPDAPRYIETADEQIIAGLAIPLIRLWPQTPALALRAELAVKRYGLSPCLT